MWAAAWPPVSSVQEAGSPAAVWVAVVACISALAAALHAQLLELGWTVVELLSAAYLSMRYFTGPSCWLLFGFVFWTEPMLRLPLLLYHLWIISPAGRAAVAHSRWPWLLRRLPLWRGFLTYFPGSRIVKTADLDPQRRYIFAGHPHGLLGNCYFLAFCTDVLDFRQLYPGIRLSIGGWQRGPAWVGWPGCREVGGNCLSCFFAGTHLSPPWPCTPPFLAGVLDLNLCVSFCREICLLFGLCDVDRHTLLARLRQGPGSAVFLAVGGAAESLLTQVGAWSGGVGSPPCTPHPARCLARHRCLRPCPWLCHPALPQPGTMDLVLKRRKGFVRVALEAGADLVQNEVYQRSQLVPGSLADRMQTATKQVSLGVWSS